MCRGMQWCVVLMQNPQVVFPQFRSYLTDCFVQTPYDGQIVFCIDFLTRWKEFLVHNTAIIKENREHDLDFWLQTASSLRTCFIFQTPFWWLLHCFDVVLVNPCFIISYDPFHVCAVSGYRRNHLRRHQHSIIFWRKIRFFGIKRDATRFMYSTLDKMCWHDPNDIPTSSTISRTVNRRFWSTNSFTFLMWASSVDVDSIPERGLSSTDSRPFWNS